jgi:hypothetical protein
MHREAAMWFGDALDQQVKADADGWLTAHAFGAELTIPVGAAVAWRETEDARRVREVLNETFVAPRVMWSPLERETPEQVLESLGKLEPALRTRAKEFRKRHSEADRALGACLESWADAACLCAKAVRDGAKKGRDPGNTGMGTDARDAYWGPIGGMRLSAYPVVTMILAALPEADPVRIEAVRRLEEGVEDLRKDARRYRFSQEKLDRAGFFPSSGPQSPDSDAPPDMVIV